LHADIFLHAYGIANASVLNRSQFGGADLTVPVSIACRAQLRRS
jgi:hypothetical protein